MKLTVTERDKRLLRLVLILAAVAVSVRFLILPALDWREELESQLADVTAQRQEWEEQIALLDTIDDTIAQNEARRDEVSQPFYRTKLETRQIDDIITELELASGLFPETLDLTEPAPGTAAAYVPGGADAADQTVQSASVEDDTSAAEDGTTDGGTQAQVPADPRYVYIGTATLGARGGMEQWLSFLDRAAAAGVKLRVTSFQVSEAAYIADSAVPLTTERITCTMELYMCVDDGEETVS